MKTMKMLYNILLFIMNKLKKTRRFHFRIKTKPKKKGTRNGDKNYPRNELKTTSCSTEIEIKNDVSVNFLLCRWLLTITFTIILCLSIIQFGRDDLQAIKIKYWPIFLSHWGLIINVAQALTGAIITTYLFSLGEMTYYCSLGFAANIYRILHSTSTTLSLFITFAFWLFIYNPETSLLDFVSLLTHSFTSIIMLIDFIYCELSYYLIDLAFPVMLALIYISFTAIYYISGGEDGKGNNYIYAIINWKKPKDTCLFLSTFMLAVILIYIFLWIISTIKIGLRKLVRARFGGRSRFQHVV